MAAAEADFVPRQAVRAHLKRSGARTLGSSHRRSSGDAWRSEHDRLVALTSHLPQLISTALAASISVESGAERVAGPAALDLTRLALSPYEIWRDIFATNAGPIDAALGMFIGKLEELRRTLRDPVIEREFDVAAASARRLRHRD